MENSKQQLSFRLDRTTIRLLKALKRRFGTMTSVVREGIHLLAEREGIK